MIDWKGFGYRNELPFVTLKVTWKVRFREMSDTFITYHFIGRLPPKYHSELCKRFEEVFVVYRQKTFKKEGVEFVSCCVISYDGNQLHNDSFIAHANEFVEANCRMFEERDWLEYKRSKL